LLPGEIPSAVLLLAKMEIKDVINNSQPSLMTVEKIASFDDPVAYWYNA
jgi:hypothetical protein